MAKRYLIPLVACLAVIAPAGAAYAQKTQFSLDLGYQWLDVSGNKDVYRSQVNEDEGALLQGFSLTTLDTATSGKLFDRIRVSASGFGGSPQGRFHVDAGLAHAYNLRIDYRRANHFNALPSYANPLMASGVEIGQHTLDRTSDNLDVNLELFPGHVVTPLIGYRWYELNGPSTTTYHQGEHEFKLTSDLALTVHELRGGLALNLPGFQANAIYGQRSYSEKDESSLAPSAGGGNSTRQVLGRDITMSDLYRHAKTEGTVPFTTASFSGSLGSIIRVVGSYVRADNEATYNEAESYGGSLASFDLSRFYARFAGNVQSKVDSPDRRFNTHVEADVMPWLGIEVGYTDRQRTQDGWSVISGTYFQTVNFSGFDPKDVQALVETASAVERSAKTVEATISSRDLGALRLFASAAQTTEDLTVKQDVAEIVIPGGQGGTFDRRVDDLSVGAAVGLPGLKVSIDFRSQQADALILRTDYRDQDRLRFRADVSAGAWLRVLGTAERIESKNPDENINLDSMVTHYGLDLNLIPTDWLTIRLGGGKFETNSTILTRNPMNFTMGESLYTEDGRSIDGGVNLKLGRVGFDAGYSRFENKGSYALELTRAFAHLDITITKEIGVIASYEQRKYTEDALSLADYDAKRYGVFLRWQK
jgi:hypothetical protein